MSQGGRSLEQYEIEFSRLLQYALESYKHSEELKRQVFLNGLDEDLRIKLEEFDIKSYSELVERARIVENARKRKHERLENKIMAFKKRSFDGTSSSTRFKVLKATGDSNEEKSATMIHIQCWKCKGKHYPKQCPSLQSKCYLCGNPNHKIRNYPKKTSTICFICTQKGHLANKYPGRKNPVTSHHTHPRIKRILTEMRMIIET